MFEMVLANGAPGQTNRGAGVVASFLLHGAALAAAVALSAGAKQAASKLDRPLPPVVIVSPPLRQMQVTFQEPAPAAPKPAHAAAVRTQAPHQPAAKPPPADPDKAVVNPAAQPGSLDSDGGNTSDGPTGAAGGPPAGPPGGPCPGNTPCNGTGQGAPAENVVMSILPGMTPPRRIAGADPTYTREALSAHVEGKVIVKCAVMVDGSVRDCRVIKGLPYMDQAVVQALLAQRYAPAIFQGRPVSVSNVFSFNFKMP